MFEKIKKLFKGKQDQKETTGSDTVERRVMHNCLTITMMDGKNLEWAIEDWKGKHRLKPWTNFYKWYFAKDNPHYVMKYKNGETMFKRADIRTFTVHTWQVKDSA